MNGTLALIAGMGMAALAAVSSTSCTGADAASGLTASGLTPAAFDTVINQKAVKLYTLKNAAGMEACITNFGGRVVSLVVPDKDGKPTDVVLGYDNIAQYAGKKNSSATILPETSRKSASSPLCYITRNC